MKLVFIEDNDDFIGLDLIPEEDGDRHFCRGINMAFRVGDLHICTEKSCLIIGYDGEERSFQIKEKERIAIKKSLNAVFNGTARFLAGSTLVYDVSSKSYYCICILRLLGKIKEEGSDFQRKLVKSYIPPLILVNGRSNGKSHNLSIQKKLTDDSFSIAQNKPLFRRVGRKSTQEELV